MNEGEETEEDGINTKSIDELVRTIDKSSNEAFAFLIGAGVSRPEPAQIPTAGELINQFKREVYEDKFYLSGDEPNEEDVSEWAKEYESNNKSENQHSYGFWFSKSYPKPGSRRERIRDIVQGREPPFGQIILAKMMNEGVISHTFTPNFDDLLFKALYNLSETRPLFVDHEAKAPRFNMSGDREAIIKLHGDYLHYTQNTTEETTKLKENVRDRFEQSLTEYGLVVVGYGGNDNSIMNMLEDIYGRNSESEHGLFWCLKIDVEDCEYDLDDVLEDKELLYEQFDEENDKRLINFLENADNAEVVPIKGSTNLFTDLWIGINEIELPQPEKIRSNADERIQKIRNFKNTALENVTNDELFDKHEPHHGDVINEGKEQDDEVQEIGLNDKKKRAQSLLWDGLDAASNNKYQEALNIINKAKSLDPENYKVYEARGWVKIKTGENEDAISDYNKAIELGPNEPSLYSERGIAKARLGMNEEAIEDYNKAIELDPENPTYYNNRGDSFLTLNKFEEAKSDFEFAHEQDKSNVLYTLNLAQSHLITGEVKRARELARRANIHCSEIGTEAISLLLIQISRYLRDDDSKTILDEYRSICESEFSVEWNLEHLDTWVDNSNITDGQKDKISQWIDLLRDHTQN